MLEQLKLLLEINDDLQDDVLLSILEIVSQEFRDYCRRDDIDKFSSLIVNMAVFRYNQIGNEMLESENYSDISFKYSMDYPENIQRQLRNCRKLMVI
jgi:hypothetical protein